MYVTYFDRVYPPYSRPYSRHCLLPHSSPHAILFCILNCHQPSSLISVVHLCMDVALLTEVWATYQQPCPQRGRNLFSLVAINY